MNDTEQPAYLNEEYVSRLNELGDVLQKGENDRANQLIGELTTIRESALFQELGKLTREIHESINAFSGDERIVELTEEDIPDAKERLNFIITKTNDAAHRTMTGAEATMDVIDNLIHVTDDLGERWGKFRNSSMSKDEFLSLGGDLDKFLASVRGESSKVKSHMTDIMMAQDYQDLTGQMIKQVMEMVKDVEEKMVRLVALSGVVQKAEKKKEYDGTVAHGPQLPTADKSEVATNQDEVDDILASLGF